MKNITKRLLSLVLCLALCLSMMVSVFAADQNSVSLSLSKASVESSTEAQTVVLNINADNVSVDSLMYTVELPDGWTATNLVMPSAISGYSWANNTLAWYYQGASGTNVDNLTSLGAVEITIPAGAVAASYDIKVTGFDASASEAFWAQQASYTTTLTIAEAAAPSQPTPGVFTAEISANELPVRVGDTVTATITVVGELFASSQVTVTYPSALLTYVSTANLGANGSAVANAGTLTIVDAGEPKTANTYTITFTAAADGVATIDVTSAAFSTDGAAPTENLFPITNDPAAVSVTIEKKAHTVTITVPQGENASEWFVPDSATVTDGADYTFTASGWDNYDYPEITYTMGGTDMGAITPDANGNYTILNVTGDIVITMSELPTPKSYSVTINGDTAANDGATATYGTPYSFTLPENLAQGLADGYTYTLTSVTIGGEDYTGYSAEGKVYTIPGKDITGDIVITITKDIVAADQFEVSVDGTGAGDAAVADTVVDKGEDAVITLTKDAAYDYVVTATMGGVDMTESIVVSGDTYTVENVTGTVVFTVTKTLKLTDPDAEDYVTMNGTKMWLVTVGNGNLDSENRVYAYDGNKMYWSTKYQAYCYLVIADANPAADADAFKALFTLVEGTATAVNYGMNVNMADETTVDANDAQLVYNMYNAKYSGFDGSVTMEKFLRADVNDAVGIDMTDAAAIVAFLNPTPSN